MTSLGSNLKILMSHKKINASELARQTGVAQPIIHRIITGKNNNPKLATIKPISEYFSIRVSQLLGEETLGNHTEEPSLNWNNIPLLSWEKISVWIKESKNQKKIAHTTYAATDAQVSESAYALAILSQEMEPFLLQGSIVIIEPTQDPKDLDFVLISSNKRKAPAVKQIIIDNQTKKKYLIPPPFVNNKKEKGSQLKKGHTLLGVLIQSKTNYQN